MIFTPFGFIVYYCIIYHCEMHNFVTVAAAAAAIAVDDDAA